MNSKSNLNSNSLSEVCKRKEEEDPAQTQNEKLNPAQTAKSHRPKPAQATQPAFSSLPSRVRPSSIFLGPPFFPHGPACPHLPLGPWNARHPPAERPGPLVSPSFPPALSSLKHAPRLPLAGADGPTPPGKIFSPAEQPPRPSSRDSRWAFHPGHASPGSPGMLYKRRPHPVTLAPIRSHLLSPLRRATPWIFPWSRRYR